MTTCNTFSEAQESLYRLGVPRITITDTSSEWAGMHLRFQEDRVHQDAEDSVSPRKWHFAAGHHKTNQEKKWSGANQEKWVEEGVACVNASSDEWDRLKADNDFREKGIRRRAGGNSRTNQVKKFKEKAKKGDKVFLSCLGEVTHVGIWTGKITKSIPYKFSPGEVDYSSHLPSGELSFPLEGKYRSLDEGHYIRVEKWIPLQSPHRGAGNNATLYEVTEERLKKMAEKFGLSRVFYQ
jgi:hypothetical protein